MPIKGLKRKHKAGIASLGCILASKRGLIVNRLLDSLALSTTMLQTPTLLSISNTKAKGLDTPKL
jgi:hypothetical protein